MPVLVPDKVNMNYANMIEEKSLKKTFIIATLVSTLVGTFAASHNLYERLSQKKKDGAQDDAIKKLNDKIDELQKNGGGGGGGGGDGSGQGKKSEELRHSLDSSGVLIRREYDVGYDRLGRRFAIGDLITENELQKQIIMLQQTVISVLEDAMYHNRQIDPAGIDHLVMASRAARNGSLDALKGQYQRLLLELPLSAAPLPFIRTRSPPPPPPIPLAPGMRQQEKIRVVHQVPREPPTPSSSRPTTKRLPPLQLPPPPPPPLSPVPRGPSDNTRGGKKASAGGAGFFCRYSLDLQRTSSLPLSQAFDPWPGGGRKSHCPACRVPIGVDATDMWEIEIPVLVRDRAEERAQHQRDLDRVFRKDRKKNDGADDIVAVVTTTKQQREVIKRFRVPARFVVKCHTPEGDFACVLCCGPQDGWCARGEEVVLCDDPEALIDHVAREHRVGDLENEWDILPG